MHAAYIANHLADLHQRLANVRAWEPSARRDALIEEYEAQIEEYTDAVELGAQIAQIAEESAVVEVSGALDRAMTSAKRAGCALVKGAARMGVELERHAPGCCVQRGPVRIWTVEADGGEYRLVVRDGSFNGAMHWRAR